MPSAAEGAKSSLGGVGSADTLPPGGGEKIGRLPALVELPIEDAAGVPRVLDLALAERLGFDSPYNIRKLIKRHEADLQRFGGLLQVEKTPGRRGGRPTTEFSLNEEQALFITSKCTTPTAADVTVMIVRTFVAWRNGRLAPTPAFDVPTTLSGALRLAADQAAQLEVQTQRIAHLTPKAMALERIAGTRGSLNLRESAKLLRCKEPALIADLKARRIIYRRAGQKGWLGFADKEAAGLIEHKHSTVQLRDGREVPIAQVRLTTKLLTRLAEERSGGQLELIP